MKKIILIVGLISVYTIGAGPAKAAIVAITSPVLIPGAYYGVKSYLQQKNITETCKNKTYEQAGECDAQIAQVKQKFQDYLDGVSWGIGFPINAALLSGEAKKLSAPVVDLDKMKQEQAVGFFSGLSVYGTLPAVLSLLKRMPK